MSVDSRIVLFTVPPNIRYGYAEGYNRRIVYTHVLSTI